MPYRPHFPQNGPRRVNPQKFGTTMGVVFDPVVGYETGGAEILSYWLEADSTGSGTGPFVEIGGYTTDSLQMNYIIENLESGKIYYFRYWAKNS